MNTDHPDSRRTASEIRAIEAERAKQPLPAAWVYVESTANGGVFRQGSPPRRVQRAAGFRIQRRPRLRPQDRESFCPESGEHDLQAQQIRKISERLLGAHGDNIRQGSEIKDLENALLLMTAGRDVDRSEHQEVVKTYQTRVDSLVEQCNQLQAGCTRLKEQRNEARAEIHACQTRIVQLRQEAFPVDLENVRLKQELQCATKQRDEYKEHADRNRTGRVTAENELRRLQLSAPGVALAWKDTADERLDQIRRLQEEIRALNNKQANQPMEIQPEEVQISKIRACVDGKYYTLEDLCKEHSALKADYNKIQNQPIQVLPDINVSIAAKQVEQRDVLIKALHLECGLATGAGPRTEGSARHLNGHWTTPGRVEGVHGAQQRSDQTA